MLTNEELQALLLSSLDGASHVVVTGDGYHYRAVIVSDVFLGKSKVARQQWVYAVLKQEITTGRLHALSMETWTKSEWEKQGG